MEKLPGHTYEFKVLLRVYISLLVLAGAMIGISRLPLEALPLDWIDMHVLKGLLILGVAIVMTSIVAGFLMGLKYEKTRLNTLVFLGNFAFLALFVAFTWADVNFRGLIDPAFEKQLNWESPVIKANEAAAAEEEYEDEDYEDEEDYDDEADYEDEAAAE
jgi:caa(3)-type oxidase subunit IV